MKIKDFSTFVKTANENSDSDWSDKNWDEAGVDGENPSNPGSGGTSEEPLSYTAGDYGEIGEEDTYIDDEEQDPLKFKAEMENIKALIDDLTERINMLTKNKTVTK